MSFLNLQVPRSQRSLKRRLGNIRILVSKIIYYLIIRKEERCPWTLLKGKFGDGATQISGTNAPSPIAGWRNIQMKKYKEEEEQEEAQEEEQEEENMC